MNLLFTMRRRITGNHAIPEEPQRIKWEWRKSSGDVFGDVEQTSNITFEHFLAADDTQVRRLSLMCEAKFFLELFKAPLYLID